MYLKNGIILDRNYYDVNIKEVGFHIPLSPSDVITFYYLNSSIPMDNYLLNNLKVNINKGFLDNSVNNIQQYIYLIMGFINNKDKYTFTVYLTPLGKQKFINGGLKNALKYFSLSDADENYTFFSNRFI